MAQPLEPCERCARMQQLANQAALLADEYRRRLEALGVDTVIHLVDREPVSMPKAS